MSKPGGSPRRHGRAATFVSTILIGGGALLLLAAVGLQLYSTYAEMRWERARSALSSQYVPQAAALAAEATATPTIERPAPTPTETSSAPPPSAPAEPGIPAATPTPQATPTQRTAPTAQPALPSDPGTLMIPKLKVAARIVTIPLLNGQWDVSKIVYDVGLLEGTGFRGQPGNAALSGHVTLRGRGDGPFRWLEKLAPQDEIIVEQGDLLYSYRVTSSRVVLPSDVSVIAPTPNPTLTLITCINWDFLKAEYTHRLVVAAQLTGQRTRSSPAQ